MTMLIVAIIPVFFILVGALMWALLTNPLFKEMGKILFAVGAFWLCYAMLGKTVHIG